LIAALPEPAADAADNILRDAPGDRWQQAMRASAAPEIVAATATALAPIALRNPQARGGSRLLADQAACPFRAFASHRLGAKPLERPQAGLDAMRKGSLLHEVLERVWQALQSQANLLAMQADELADLVRASIGEVLKGHRRRSPATFTPRLGAANPGTAAGGAHRHRGAGPGGPAFRLGERSGQDPGSRGAGARRAAGAAALEHLAGAATARPAGG
jgi:hypothetical protein